MKRLVLITLALVFALALMSSPASANQWHNCGSQTQPGAGWYNLQVNNMHCATARKVARRYANTFIDQQLRFTCQVSTFGEEPDRVACSRDAGDRLQRLHFEVRA